MDINQYTKSSTNWRQTIRQNTRRSYFVIVLFFLIYLAIGMLVDMYLQSAMNPLATMQQLFYALITFQVLPIATLIMFVIAALSLFVTYSFYDKLMLLGTDYHEITPQTAQNVQEQQLYNVVEEMKVAAALKYMPKVFIIDADYMNAFASGYSEKSAMVAITRGLISKLNRDELQAVMAHELSHIRHLDIKLTLTASLLSNLILIILDLFFYNTFYSNRGNGQGRARDSLASIILILRFILPVISVLLILYLSRTRELMADAGCVELMRDNGPLARALLKIQEDYVQNANQYKQQIKATPHENVRREAYIYDPQQAGIFSVISLSDLFSTHPSIEARLKALGFSKKLS